MTRKQHDDVHFFWLEMNQTTLSKEFMVYENCLDQSIRIERFNYIVNRFNAVIRELETLEDIRKEYIETLEEIEDVNTDEEAELVKAYNHFIKEYGKSFANVLDKK